VDGYNVLHAVILRGRDRAHFWSVDNQRRVAELAARFEAGEVWLVFDASSRVPERLEEGACGVECLYAPSADERIVELAASWKDQRRIVVVSADRQLCDRARNHGAERMSPWAFAAACGEDPATSPH
jgi:predicted RNA-binding protein with PIN domain